MSRYCAAFVRTSISGESRPANAVTVCDVGVHVTLIGIEEDATYNVVGHVINTASTGGPDSAPIIATTKSAGKNHIPVFMRSILQ